MLDIFTKVALLVSVMGASCPDTTSSCFLNCTSSVCNNVVNCSTNAACTALCNGNRACSGFQVNGVYNPNTGPNDYAVTCQGTYDCQDATYTARTATTTRFNCLGIYSCTGTTFNCNSDNCELVCDNDSTSCRNLGSFNCLGGPGKTCSVVCNQGCYNSINVACQNYPCNVSVTGTGSSAFGFTPPCPSGQFLCGDGTCVNSTATSCPSQCLNNDPCQTSAGNLCADVGAAGGPYNCTCSAASYFAGRVAGNLVQSCFTNQTQAQTEGTSLTLQVYSNNACTGSPVSTKTYPKGCANGSPSAGQFIFSQCTNLYYCQSSPGTGTCGGISLACNPTTPIGKCVNGVIGSCGGTSNHAESASVAAAFVIAVFAVLF